MSGNDDDKQMIEKYVYPIKEWEANHPNDIISKRSEIDEIVNVAIKQTAVTNMGREHRDCWQSHLFF